jgi:metal-sulfur cluster biosynthetic enzyme
MDCSANNGQTGIKPTGENPDGLEELVWAELRQCYDPEIPLNIVDLGLVYSVSVRNGQANVKMTLTSPGCHLGGQIAGNVQERLLSLDPIQEANVELVWDPPWHQSLISPEGRKALGLEAV